MLTRREAAAVLGIGALTISARSSLVAGIKRPIPRLSDSLVSLRFASPSPKGAIDAYRPDRIEWHYLSDPKFVTELKSLYRIPFVGGTINASPELIDPSGYAQSLDGHPLVAPWMRSTKFRRASTANPATHAFLFAWVDRNLNAGCDGIQVDDGAFQWAGEEWGGDFSPHALAGFGSWLAANVQPAVLGRLDIRASNTFDYKAWLAEHANVRTTDIYVERRGTLPLTPLWRRYLGEMVLDFYKQLRQHIVARSAAIPLSMNFGRLEPNEYFSALGPLIDYTVTEVQANDPPWRYALAGATAESIELRFAGCFSNRANRLQLRQAIACCHASGIVPVAPWDGFVPAAQGTFVPRFTPPPEDYADLFLFARTNARYLDGWTGGATVGIVVDVGHYNPTALGLTVQRLVAKQVPFRIIMIGGDVAPRMLTREALMGLSAVIQVNQMQSLDSRSIAVIQSSGLPSLDVSQAGRFSLGDMGGRRDWHMTVRHRLGLKSSNVLHIVAAAPDAAPFSGKLRLAEATSFGFEKQATRILLRPGMSATTVRPISAVGALVYELPQIREWGLLVPA